MTNKERRWCENALGGGSFVKAFATAAMNADDENFLLIQPVLAQMMIKYPYYAERGPARV